MLGTIGFNTPVVKGLMHTPEGQRMVNTVKQTWARIPQIQRTKEKANQLWTQVISHRKFQNPNQVLPDETNMTAADLATKYSDRNDKLATQLKPFVTKYLPPK